MIELYVPLRYINALVLVNAQYMCLSLEVGIVHHYSIDLDLQ